MQVPTGSWELVLFTCGLFITSLTIRLLTAGYQKYKKYYSKHEIYLQNILSRLCTVTEI